MQAPRLAPDVEERRDLIVEQIQPSIREDAALKSVAESASLICGAPMAHVSLMEGEHQCVIGHVGMETTRFERDQTFCAHTIAQKDVMIVEDATRDERFRQNPFVTGEAGISFYVGLPLLVENTPVGTLCAIDTEPRPLGVEPRGELFGLVNVVESHLEVVYLHGAQSLDHGISSKLTAVRALAAKERYRGEEPELIATLRQLEAEASRAFKLLVDRPTFHEVELGMADTDVELAG